MKRMNIRESLRSWPTSLESVLFLQQTLCSFPDDGRVIAVLRGWFAARWHLLGRLRGLQIFLRNMVAIRMSIDRKSFRRRAPKADMCCATRDVRFGPKADIVAYSKTLSARDRTASGISSPICLAALRLIVSNNRSIPSTGRSMGLVPLRTR
jgi:hypothetical protein